MKKRLIKGLSNQEIIKAIAKKEKSRLTPEPTDEQIHELGYSWQGGTEAELADHVRAWMKNNSLQ